MRRAIVLIALGCAVPGLAHAELRTIGSRGLWSAFEGSGPDQRQVCGISTGGPDGRQISVMQYAGDTGLVVTFALSYSSRREILRACQKIAEQAARGAIKPSEITEETLSRNLYTADMPDPELLIRTSGEMRISNFLLWQISYAELYVTQRFWPEFTRDEFEKALDEYTKRERRFGDTCAVNGGKA